MKQRGSWQMSSINYCATIGWRDSPCQNGTSIKWSKDEFFELHITALPSNNKKQSDWLKLTDFSFKTFNINFGLDQAALPDCFCSSYLYRFFHVVDSFEVDCIVVIVFFYKTYVFNHTHIVHVCYTSVVYLIAKRALLVSQNPFQCK